MRRHKGSREWGFHQTGKVELVASRRVREWMCTTQCTPYIWCRIRAPDYSNPQSQERKLTLLLRLEPGMLILEIRIHTTAQKVISIVASP